MRRKPHSNRFKRLRHAIRFFESNEREAVYEKHRIRRHVEPTYTRRLSPSCGRSLYQQTKRTT